MKNKKQLNNLIEKAVKSCIQDSKISEQKVLNIVKVLKQLPVSSAVTTITMFYKKIAREIAKTTMEVYSTSTLSQEDQQQILKKFKKSLPVMSVKNIIDPNLLAGIKIRIFDTIYDYSLNNKVMQIGERING